MKTHEQLARIFKALADPTRLAILARLRECCSPGCCLPEGADETTVSILAERLGLALSLASHHLKELRLAGLVECEKHGRFVHCVVNEEALTELRRFLGGEGDTVPVEVDGGHEGGSEAHG